MTMQPAAQTRDVISFGPFSLVARERLLLKDGAPIELGERTLDTLIALASRPNEVLGKRDLMAMVWPDVTVEEGSLRFHIAGLRKALGDGEDGARYITTFPGRGYCFVAPVSRSTGEADGDAGSTVPRHGATFLPARLMRMVGRDDGVLSLSSQLAASRFVTIAGPGGVGKTTVAVAVAHDLLEDFAGAVLFFDLGMLNDPNMVAASLASMLGISIQSDDPTPGLIAYLRDRRFLLILDNCEHLIEAVADLAACLFLAAPQVHILATSREALRVEGERVHRLVPLTFPPDEPGLTAAVALTFPAVQLFVERAAASGTPLDLSDADAATVAGICRKLDGVALAIELAAGRVEAYGLQQTADLLDQRLTLLWLGQRTAPPRQKTLQATLDWSYGLLSGPERTVLRGLAVFVGHFTLEAALAVVPSAALDQALVLGAIDSLVAKSMVATNRVGTLMRYRLLATTRTYALAISVDEAEVSGLAARHAIHYRGWLEQIAAELPGLANTAERAPHLADLGNARAALEWCFGAHGDAGVGIGLAVAATPVFLSMSLLTECHRWSERAIHALGDVPRPGGEEMHLQAALGLSSMFTRGSSEAARAALNRSLAIAEDRGDTLNQLQLLGVLHMFHHRIADLRAALHYGRRSAAVSRTIANPGALALGHSLLGFSLFLTGDLDAARVELEAALRLEPSSQRTGTSYLGFDGHNMASVALARVLWLQGHPAQAVEQARRAVQDAASTGHPVRLSVALVWAISVAFGIGDLQSAEEHIDRFASRAESHSLGPYLAVGRGFKGQLAIRRGDAKAGVESLQGCLEELHAARYELLTAEFNMSLVQGLAALGRFAEGMALIDETIGRIEVNGDLSYLPEALRMKAHVLLSLPQPQDDHAETCLKQSLDLSRRQAALSWELRAAIDLAALLAAGGRSESAAALLLPLFERFPAGSDTADLKAAERLLADLGSLPKF
jgi:predicted ATPase/DNA-binding winged helix-turn-helix (wHTH) protein